MRPKFCCRMTFHAGLVTKNAPLRWTSTSGLSRSSVISSKSASLTVPALLMRMSTRPHVLTAVSMIAWPPSGVATLLVSATASPPLSLISCAVSLAGLPPLHRR